MNDEVEEPMSDQSTAEKPLPHPLHNAPPAAGCGPAPDLADSAYDRDTEPSLDLDLQILREALRTGVK
jgi:hypothetical protein